MAKETISETNVCLRFWWEEDERLRGRLLTDSLIQHIQSNDCVTDDVKVVKATHINDERLDKRITT